MEEEAGDGEEGRGDWEEHRRAQLLRQSDLPLPEKLQWLEEAQRLAENLLPGPPVTPATNAANEERREAGEGSAGG